MRKALLVVVLTTAVTAGAAPTPGFATSEPVPCAKALDDVRNAIKGAALSEIDKAKVSDIQSQGLERCKADDDAGADALFAEALKIIGK
jgi:2-methylisocitrate lyase-like PEP mutase family enzyme